MIILIFILLVAGVLFLVFGLFNKDKHDYNANVKSISYAMSNIAENLNNSGTVRISMEMSRGSYLDMNMSAFFKYVKNNDGYDFQLGVDKTLYMDEINAYASLTANDFTIYFPSSIFEFDNGLFAANSSSNLFANNSSWYKFYLKFSDIGFDSLDTIMNDIPKIEKEKIDYKKLFPESNLKYMGKENNLEHYQLYFDENFYKYVYADLEKDEELLTQLKNYSYFVDVYLNSKGELTKISSDLSNFMNEGQIQFDKLLFIIEFEDLNNTVINIPQDVITSSKNINELYSNSSSMLDFDSLLDTNFSLNF